MDNLLGNKYDKLLVIEYLCSKKHWIEWVCLCECGNKCIRRSYLLKKNKNNSCGCAKHYMWKGAGELCGSFWSALEYNASRRKMVFELDVEYAWGLFVEQNKKCALTGLPLEMIKIQRKGAGKIRSGDASLDRKDSSRGYINGNVWWVHKTVNMIKYSHTISDFIEICKAVYFANTDTNYICDSNVLCSRYVDSKYYYGRIFEKIDARTWYNIQYSAKQRKLDFDINLEYAWDIFKQQYGLCAITKAPIYFSFDKIPSKGTASLDRIDSSKGYLPDNIWWVHKIINHMKSDLTLEIFIKYCILVYTNNYNKMVDMASEARKCIQP